MANSASKLTIEFKDLRGGWSETYYLGQPGSNTPKEIVDAVVTARAKVLGEGVTIVLARYGQTDKPRSILKFKKNQPGVAADIGGNNAGVVRHADQRDTSVLMPYRTSDGTLRYVTVGGFPDEWVDRRNPTEDMALTDVGLASINPFYDFLLKAPYALAIRQRLRTGGNAAVAVTDVAEHTDGKYRIQSTAAAALTSGDKVVLTGLKGNNLANAKGVRKVADVLDATHFTIDRGPRADLGVPDLTVNALVSKVGYSYETAIASPEAYVLTTRRRGRGFSQRRGRRSASK